MSFKVFDKWDLEEVKIEDQGLVNYVWLDEILVPHTMGRHVKRQFAKSRVSIVERLMNKIMRTERNSGKKNKAYNIVRDSMEIINKRYYFMIVNFKKDICCINFRVKAAKPFYI